MRILRQDKEAIINYNNIARIMIDVAGKEYVIIAETVNNACYTLGKYNTKERAKKIIQDICYINDFNNQYNMPEE